MQLNREQKKQIDNLRSVLDLKKLNLTKKYPPVYYRLVTTSTCSTCGSVQDDSHIMVSTDNLRTFVRTFEHPNQSEIDIVKYTSLTCHTCVMCKETLQHMDKSAIIDMYINAKTPKWRKSKQYRHYNKH